MKEYIPIPGTAKARLLEQAILSFGEAGYEAVNVVDLARAAGVTTGAIYHHFGSKLELYRIVREEIERRVVDRMEGAAAVFDDTREAICAALIVGFDAAVKFQSCRLLCEPNPSTGDDLVVQTLSGMNGELPEGVPAILAAGWRAALGNVANGMDPAVAKASLTWAVQGK